MSSPPRKPSAACWCWKIRRCAARRASPIPCSPASSSSCRVNRAGAPPRLLRDPLRARWRGRIHRREGREGEDVAGRLLMTPNWAPHDHGNPSDQADAVARRTRHADGQPFRDVVHRALRRRGAEHAAQGWRLARPIRLGRLAGRHRGQPEISPVINYTYARTRPILERMKKSGDIDKRHGARVRYGNPTTGGWALPTMGAHLACCRAGSRASPIARPTARSSYARRRRQTRSATRSSMGPERRVRPPPWMRYAHTAAKESVLFSISDRPMQEALGIWREAA